MTPTRRHAVRTLAALVAAALPAAALAAPNVTTAYAATPYTFAATCDAGKPVVFVNLLLHNGDSAPSEPVRLTATDSAGMLDGDTTLPQLPAGAHVAATLPLHRIGPSAVSLGGTHVLSVAVMVGGKLKKSVPAPLSVPIPATFCGPAAATTPAPGAAQTMTAIRRAPSAAVIASSAPTTMTAVNHRNIGTFAVGPPNNVHSTGSGTDCGAHVGPLGALVCPDMIKSGDLLLIWDWAPGAGPADIDGYRVYRVDSGLKQLVYTRANKKDLTLVDVPKPAGGYTGKCYAVTAYVAARESVLSPAFCAGGASVAKTVRLSAIHARSSSKVYDHLGNPFTGLTGSNKTLRDAAIMVGYSYSSREHTLGDTVDNQLLRGAVAFDVSSVINHPLVSAKLRLNIQSSAGQGNNHSCITNVLTGTDFWWLTTDWLEVPAGDHGALSANSVPTDTGPEISADVTQLVAPWLRGEPNYGFVLINSDENIAAFTNKQCQTSYANPVLEITYY